MFENLVGLQPKFIEERNNKCLIIWPEIPNWLVADKELSEIIEKFDSKTPIGEIIKNFLKKNIAEEKINEIIPKLIETGIIFDINNGLKIRENKSEIEDVCIHTTLMCNLKCKTCYNSRVKTPKKELSVSEIKKFLDQTVDFISDKCCLSILGGEPLLVPKKTLDIAKYAKKLGFKWRNVSTNGTLITRDFAKQAKNIGLQVQVSLDGESSKTNDIFRGEGSFKKAIEGVKILVEEGTHSVLCMTYHSGNFHNIKGYYELALKLGVNETRFAPLKYIGGGNEVSVKKIPVSEMIKRSYNMFKEYPGYLALAGRDHFSTFAASCKLGSKTSYCGTGSRMVLLNSNGDIYPCVNHFLQEFKAGNILEKPFSEIWTESPVLKKIREIYPLEKRNKKCSNCVVRHWCLGGCRGETYQVTHSLESCAIDCSEIKKGVIEMFWLLSGETNFCEEN
jgi:radical SAM protein with 4Fe4S-binding SPASM domain